MPRPTVLISGASVAYWLNRFGWRTTVVERSNSLRGEGQNIDVRGAGREVARRMGIEAAIRDAHTGERGTRFVGSDGAVKASFPAATSDTRGATAELEILRGELARILVEQTRDDTEYLFGDHITGLDERDDGVTVSFAHAGRRRFDVVIVADGMRSQTRTLIFGDEARVRPLGMYTAWLTVPRIDTDTQWASWYNATRGRAILLRPDNLGTARAALSFLSEPRGYEDLDREQQRDVLRERFTAAGWQTQRLLDELDRADFYFEAVGQVHAPRWSTGRTVLLGDAAYAASPISGMGTSLAPGRRLRPRRSARRRPGSPARGCRRRENHASLCDPGAEASTGCATLGQPQEPCGHLDLPRRAASCCQSAGDPARLRPRQHPVLTARRQDRPSALHRGARSPGAGWPELMRLPTIETGRAPT